MEIVHCDWVLVFFWFRKFYESIDSMASKDLALLIVSRNYWISLQKDIIARSTNLLAPAAYFPVAAVQVRWSITSGKLLGYIILHSQFIV